MKISHILSIIVVLFLFSCQNEPIDPALSVNQTAPIRSTGSFTANIDGIPFIGTINNANITGGQISITSFKGNQENFTMAIQATTVGTYPANINILDYTPAGSTQPTFISVNPANSSANTGQVTIATINAIDKTISGTFNFTAYYDNGTTVLTKQITNGIFTNIPYL